MIIDKYHLLEYRFFVNPHHCNEPELPEAVEGTWPILDVFVLPIVASAPVVIAWLFDAVNKIRIQDRSLHYTF